MSRVRVQLVNRLGRLVYEKHTNLREGLHRLTLDYGNMGMVCASGLYLLNVEMSGWSTTKKVVFLK
ncbi:T9SS type A sorting domain-containing protein [bacterium]|nr:T9SS type A sorting domain-containing protein [bacterium]